MSLKKVINRFLKRKTLIKKLKKNGKPKVKVSVNGAELLTYQGKLSYEDILLLGNLDPNRLYTVSFKVPRTLNQGVVPKGGSVWVTSGMTFNVVAT